MASEQPPGTGVEWVDGEDARMVPDSKQITRGRLWTMYLLLLVLLAIALALTPSGGLYWLGSALVGIFLLWWALSSFLATDRQPDA